MMQKVLLLRADSEVSPDGDLWVICFPEQTIALGDVVYIIPETGEPIEYEVLEIDIKMKQLEIIHSGYTCRLTLRGEIVELPVAGDYLYRTTPNDSK